MSDQPNLVPDSCAVCIFALTVREAGSTDLAALKSDALICRRYPPKLTMIPAGGGIGAITGRPQVQPGDWCGEFQHPEDVE